MDIGLPDVLQDDRAESMPTHYIPTHVGIAAGSFLPFMSTRPVGQSVSQPRTSMKATQNDAINSQNVVAWEEDFA